MEGKVQQTSKAIMQVIKDLPKREKGTFEKNATFNREFCLLDLFELDSSNVSARGMINLTCDLNNLAVKWYEYEVVKTFKSREEAEKYAKKHNVQMATGAVLD